MPHDSTAEAAVLGSIILDNEALPRVQTIIPEKEIFYREAHRIIYEAMIDLAEKGEPIDTVTLSMWLMAAGQMKKVGGGPYLIQISNETPASTSVDSYANIVRDKAIVRSIIEITRAACEEGYNDPFDVARFLDRIQGRIMALTLDSRGQFYRDMRELMGDLFAELEGYLEDQPVSPAISTGFLDLDKMLGGGARPGELIVVAGRPAMGKTALAMNMLYDVGVRKRLPGGVFSLEMAGVQLVKRLFVLETKMTFAALQTREELAKRWDRIVKLVALWSSLPIYVDDTASLDILELCARARRMKQERGIVLLVVDYLQLMRGTRQASRELDVAEMSRNLKTLAKDLEIPVIAVCQLNRELEKRKDKRPLMSDLRESGAIENDADKILLLYRDDYYKREEAKEKGEVWMPPKKTPVAEVNVAKHRNGPTGPVELLFDAPLMMFKDLTNREE